jgi:hypothetical protein
MSGRRVELTGFGHVDFEHVGGARELAGHALGERQAAARPRQHDVGPLFLGQARHGEGERRVGQHTCDQDPLAVEESHGPDPNPRDQVRCGWPRRVV